MLKKIQVAMILGLFLLFATSTTATAPSKFTPTTATFKPVSIPYDNLPFRADPTAAPTPTPSPTPRLTPKPPKVYAVPSVEEAKRYAERKIGSTQYACLYILWKRESKWNPLAKNKYSGAYGIPQALPGSRMASVGADWKTNPITQVKWGLGYIHGRYGTACNALEHSNVYNWY